jgi:Glycosyl hydrolase family 9
MQGGTASCAGPSDASDTYTDSRQSFTSNEVAVDYNAGFTGVLAALAGSTLSKTQCIANGDWP